MDIARKDAYRQGGDLVEIGDIHKLMGDARLAKENYTNAIVIYKQLEYSWKVEEITKKIKDLGEHKPRSPRKGKKA